jgi:hypothetical protein
MNQHRSRGDSGRTSLDRAAREARGARWPRGVVGAAIGIALLSCNASSDAPPAAPAAVSAFSAGVTRLVIEVDYAAGAEPFTGATAGNPWAITRTNLTRLLKEAPRELVVPDTLDQMESLADVTGETLTGDQILAIAGRHRGQASAGDTASLYVLFVNATFADDSGKRDDVLGVSLGTSGVVAMFKPVITGTDPGGKLGQGVVTYVEQSTLVHELGHALGLVNSGIAMTAPHQDTAHGAHCTNEACTMFWTNEGATGAVAFVKQYLGSNSTILFGAECLADADAAARAAP